jgi:hypothetical protein
MGWLILKGSGSYCRFFRYNVHGSFLHSKSGFKRDFPMSDFAINNIAADFGDLKRRRFLTMALGLHRAVLTASFIEGMEAPLSSTHL